MKIRCNLYVHLAFTSLWINICFSQIMLRADINISPNAKISIKENISDFSSIDTLLLHKFMPLGKNNEEEFIGKEYIYRNTYAQYKNSDGKITYFVNPPKVHYNNYFLSDSIFFISENYLAQNKRIFNSKKRYVLNIKLPSQFELVYPSKEDLNKSFYLAPPIIAGSFDEYKHYSSHIFTRKGVKVKEKRLNDIAKIINDACDYFSDIFSDQKEKPNIFFLPFDSNLLGKNIDNLIVLNERFLTEEWLNKKTLIHETLHLWWGDNSVRFENPVIMEAITEFLTLRYLLRIGEVDYLNFLLKKKKERIKAIKKYDLRFSKIENKKQYHTYSYDLLPSLLWSNNLDNKMFDILVNFHKNRSNSFVSYSMGQELMNSMNIKIISK